jgi:hypothetical protein
MDRRKTSQLAWLFLGDFNLICSNQDKNNGNIDRCMISHFRRALNHMVVKEIPFTGKKFPWSNDRNSPTMTRIDHAFCTVQWEESHMDPIMHPLFISFRPLPSSPVFPGACASPSFLQI